MYCCFMITGLLQEGFTMKTIKYIALSLGFMNFLTFDVSAIEPKHMEYLVSLKNKIHPKAKGIAKEWYDAYKNSLTVCDKVDLARAIKNKVNVSDWLLLLLKTRAEWIKAGEEQQFFRENLDRLIAGIQSDYSETSWRQETVNGLNDAMHDIESSYLPFIKKDAGNDPLSTSIALTYVHCYMLLELYKTVYADIPAREKSIIPTPNQIQSSLDSIKSNDFRSKIKLKFKKTS